MTRLYCAFSEKHRALSVMLSVGNSCTDKRGKLTGYVLPAEAATVFATGDQAYCPMTSKGLCAGALLAVNEANQRARRADASVLGGTGPGGGAWAASRGPAGG